MKIRHVQAGYFGPPPLHFSQIDSEAIEGFAFFLSVAGKPSDKNAPYRHLARYWYEGLLTVEEGKRLRDVESPGEA